MYVYVICFAYFVKDIEMEWVGYLKFPDHIQYLIENKVAKLSSTSKKEEWLECLASLKKFKFYIWNVPVGDNSNTFPSHKWTFIHQAAFHKAPLYILQIMNVDKYPLSLPDGEGRLPIDHMDPSMTQDYKDLLTPIYKLNVLPLELKLIQVNFHAVIQDRIETMIEKYNLVLPVLSVLLEDISTFDKVYFDVPGMDGGFTYWFQLDKSKTEVLSLWCRSSSNLVGYSEQLHECTAEGWALVKKEKKVRF